MSARRVSKSVFVQNCGDNWHGLNHKFPQLILQFQSAAAAYTSNGRKKKMSEPNWFEGNLSRQGSVLQTQISASSGQSPRSSSHIKTQLLAECGYFSLILSDPSLTDSDVKACGQSNVCESVLMLALRSMFVILEVDLIGQPFSYVTVSQNFLNCRFLAKDHVELAIPK